MTNASQPGPSHSMQNDPNYSQALSWEGDRMFNIYIYDYCFKRGFRKTARELLSEADLPPESQPPINARQGLLFEWWSVFWVLFTAKANGNGSDDALIYTQHQASQVNNRRGPALPPPGQPMPGTRPVPNGGLPMPGRPFPPNGPMTNGVGPNPGHTFSSANGLPPPNQPGPNFTQPPMSGQRPPLTGNPRASTGPGPFPSPTMGNSPHNPGSQQQPLMNQLGHSPHLSSRAMPPPNGMQGPPGNYTMNRPPSRSATPQMGMHPHRSPSLSARQPPNGQDPLTMELMKIPPNLLNVLKEELGLGKEILSMNVEEKQRMITLSRTKQVRKPGPPNAAPGPSMPPPGPQGRRTAGGKRNSTSPPEDPDNLPEAASPPTKRPRRSPDNPAYPQHGQPGMGPLGSGGPGPGQPPMSMRPPMAGGPMNGFQPGMGQPMGGQMPGGMGGPPMGNNGAHPHMNAMSPSMGTMSGQSGLLTPQMQPMNPPGRPQPDLQYRNQLSSFHQQRQMQAAGAGSPSEANFGGPSGPNPSAFPGGPGPGARKHGPGPGGLMPPSPGMNKDASKDGMNMKIEDSPRGMNPPSAGMTPTASGTSASTPGPGQGPGPGPSPLSGLNAPPQSSQNPTPTPNQPPPSMDPLGAGGGANPQMTGMMSNGVGSMGGMGTDLFSADFMDMASLVEPFDASIFRDSVGGDLNFERDFGQWFNPNDQVLEDSLEAMK